MEENKKIRDMVEELFLTEAWMKGRKSKGLPAELSSEEEKEIKQIEAELLKETGKTWRELITNKEISEHLTNILEMEEERQQNIKEIRDRIQFCRDHNIPIKLQHAVGWLFLHLTNAMFIGKGFVPSDKCTPEELLDTSAQLLKDEILKTTTKAERELLYKVFYVSQEIINSLSNSPDKMK